MVPELCDTGLYHGRHVSDLDTDSCVKRFSSACPVGHVMAAFSLGGLMAPIWGSITDGMMR